jgi:integrase
VLREHLRKLRLALGLGNPDGDRLLFSQPNGSPIRLNQLTRRRQVGCASLNLPGVSFHALRRTHASSLIAPASMWWSSAGVWATPP